MSLFLSPDFAILCAAAFAAGIVRGFVGFGTALVYLPLASLVLDPVSAVITIVVMDFIAPVPVIWRLRREVSWPDMRYLALATVITLPIGLATLFVMTPLVFGLVVSGLSLFMVAMMMLGWRYSGAFGPKTLLTIGGAGGFLGGIAGAPGPPVVLAYMASPLPAKNVRANASLYLYLYDILALAMILVAGRLNETAFWYGIGLILPSMTGNLVGAALFSPDKERIFRVIAYLVITLAALSGLPIWGASDAG